GHRLAGRLGVTVRDSDRVILVHAQQDRRHLVAEMIDEAVVQTAIAGARVEADIADAEAAQHLRGDVAAPADGFVDLALRRILKHWRLFDSCYRRPLGGPPAGGERSGAQIRPSRRTCKASARYILRPNAVPSAEKRKGPRSAREPSPSRRAKRGPTSRRRSA